MPVPVNDSGLKLKFALTESFNVCFHDKMTKSASIIIDDSSNIDDFQTLDRTLSPLLRSLKWSLTTHDIYTGDIPNLASENFDPYKVHETYRLGYLSHIMPLELIIVRVSPNEILYFGKDIYTNEVAYGKLNTETKKMVSSSHMSDAVKVVGDLHATLLLSYLNRDLSEVLNVHNNV